MTIAFRPLAEVKMMLEETGNDISYAYDDLIFVEHTAFLIQFDDEKPENLKLYFNTDILQEEAKAIEEKLVPVAGKRKFHLNGIIPFHGAHAGHHPFGKRGVLP